MDPYQTELSKLPGSDMYADVPLYGRYKTQQGDFVPAPRPAADVSYWDGVLELCTPETRIYGDSGGALGRDVFAVGGIIVHSGHLQSEAERREGRDYSYGDANDVAAAKLVSERIPDILVPIYYFQGKLRGCDVMIQQRVEGVGLNVAWPYLSAQQKAKFKEQVRGVVRKLLALRDPGRESKGGIQERERALLFDRYGEEELGFAHNDLNASNIIVRDDVVVGVLDWEMAGWFGREGPAEVHHQIRMPDRGTYAHAPKMTEERLADLLYWNDLYDFRGTRAWSGSRIHRESHI
ncbi:MAG: hypothetical protein M1832_005339 [Thelocarpon impressellum]|nr:MAG: hypothetical protein M1832_005339 [Thelocarpon impressellum]